MEINRIGNKKCWIKKLDFSTGGWLIGGRPTGLLISGDHLFLNYIFFFGQWWLINREGIINPHLTLLTIYFCHHLSLSQPSFSMGNYIGWMWVVVYLSLLYLGNRKRRKKKKNVRHATRDHDNYPHWLNMNRVTKSTLSLQQTDGINMICSAFYAPLP